MRANELWRVGSEWLGEAQDDATILAIRDQERAGLDIITDGEMRRESYSNRFEFREPVGRLCCMLCCMPATRTQVYLTDAQRQRIDEITQSEGVTLAEVVRRALDAYLPSSDVDAPTALRATFGADPGITVPDRDEWDRG